MLRFVAVALVVSVLIAAVCGCGSKDAGSSASTAAPPAAAPAASAAQSKYDQGPRAAEEPIQEALVERGERLFKDKGCSACHAFGRKVTGPDLNGVTMRRTSAWMENQILHPEVMTKEDPIAHELLAQYAVQMPNQKLTPDEAKAVIEYLKHQNHESNESHESH